MSFELWFSYEFLPLATMVLVPFGLFLHYWRAADARAVPCRPDNGEGAEPAEWPAAVRAQLSRARVASAIAVAAVLASAVQLSAFLRSDADGDGYLAPLLSVLLCTAVLLARPVAMSRLAGGREHGAASTPGHSAAASGARWWWVAWAMSLSALVLAVVWAGLISTPDENGRYLLHTIRIDNVADGTWVSGSTTIAGWYFGVPVIVTALLLAALVLFGVRMQTRGPLAPDGVRDLHVRRIATRTLLTLSGGAFVVTLAWVLSSIGSAARLMAGASQITVISPLAPIAVPVSVLGMVLEGIGIALLLLPLFSRLPVSAGISVQDYPAVVQTEQGVPRSDSRRAG